MLQETDDSMTKESHGTVVTDSAVVTDGVPLSAGVAVGPVEGEGSEPLIGSDNNTLPATVGAGEGKSVPTVLTEEGRVEEGKVHGKADAVDSVDDIARV